MLGIVGLVLAVGGGGVAWWAYHGAVGGDASYEWVRAVSITVGIIGVLLIFLQLRKWWLSE